jgi:hypothetical protein
MKHRYFTIDDGVCLLREDRKPGYLDYRVLHSDGQWRNGIPLAKYVIGPEIGGEEITEGEARELAAKLGGVL